MKTIPLLIGAALTATTPLWAQTNALPGDVPVRALPAPKTNVDTPPGESLTNSIFAGHGRNAARPVEKRIEPAPGGARAEFGLQKTFFPVDVKDGGPVVITAPDGRILSFRATFLALHDTTSGQSLLIAEVTNRVGAIIGDNEVIYTNAFDTLVADVRYRYTPQSLEQDIMLHEHPTIPKDFSPETTRLELWTEWFNSEPISKSTQSIDLRANEPTGLLPASVMNDEGLDFGTMKIVTGHAFSSTAQGEQTPVGKSWLQIDGRTFLVETVDYLAVKSKLDLLNSRGSGSNGRPRSGREALIRSLARKTEPLRKSEARMSMTQASLSKLPQFVMDFVIVSSVPVPFGAVSWWPAGSNANDAISSNHGTLQYGVGFGSGRVGQGFNFDGVYSRVRVPDHTSLHFTNGLTIETWIKPSNVSTYRQVVDKWDAVAGFNQRSYGLALFPGGTCYFVVSPSGTDSGSAYVATTNAAPASAWTHLAGTYDGTTLKVYFNGVLEAEGVYTGGIFPGTNALGIGGAIGGSTDHTVVFPFVGLIDEPSLYSRALSATEIEAIYNAGAAGKHNPNCTAAPTNIVAWWPGDGNGYDLARTNFATVSGATYVSAVVGQGFSFDGVDDGVTAADDNALNLATTNDQVSIEAWIKPEVNSTTYGVMSVVGKRYTPDAFTTIGYEMFLIDGKPGFQIMNLSGVHSFWATNDLRDGGYHHVVATLDRTSTSGGRSTSTEHRASRSTPRFCLAR